jgi:F-type H+-transporting ATPase subunit gamma
VTLPCREKQHREESAPLLAEIEKAILAGEDVELSFVYNELISVLEQKPTTLRVYPADASAAQPAGGTLFEPDAASLSRAVVGGYLRACFERAYWESVAGEECARLLAMRNANDNASMILDDLAVLYNKTRQARITQELSEIVSAFDVLSLVQKRTREERE